MTVTEEELQRIVARAVKVALGEIVGDGEKETPSPDQPVAKPVEVKSFGEEELNDAMNLMASNRGKGDEPMVGIFWYSPQLNEMFGVRSHRVSDYTRSNDRSEFGSVSCSEMHEDVWKKEYHRQKYKNNGIGPYNAQYPQAVELIVEEFNLGNTTYEVKTASHWDIGQKWQ